MKILRNKNISHLKAFTIIEMLIVMLLSAIVVGLTYMYFNQFQNYINQVVKTDDIYQTYGRFSMVLQKDLTDAESISSPALYELELISKNGIIEYWFDEQWVIRGNMDLLDTFLLLTGDLLLGELPDHQGLIKSISFDTEISKDKFLKFSFIKDYPSQTLFKFYEQKQP